MSANKAIGGFFEFESLGMKKTYHPNAIGLTNGRACVSYFLKNHNNIKKVYLPYYTCYALFEPFEKNNIAYQFYSIDQQLNPIEFPNLNEGDYFVLINYFGLKKELVIELIKQYGRKLIVDDTHDFFNKGYSNIYSFTSARKYFGVPDGAYLYGANSNDKTEIPRFTDVSLKHNVLRLEGRQEEAFKAYQDYEKSLGIDVLRMSKTSEEILSNIDYKLIKNKRIKNFNILYDNLQEDNLLNYAKTEIMVPFCYPLLLKKEVNKLQLYKEKIFIPTLWPDILERNNINEYEWESQITKRLLPLPVDHRYNYSDMIRMINVIKSIIS